ncbi:CoA ester lyase [Lysobacter sp. CFH 32150]|uniref:HpcH/HpaI aldolase/citrate lyase family protein n=1 Tax=Lysobacter sp. CFH 32150 TaxID=2927128 RepID=UPI001FA7F1BB|nr:CoA ester lyase [Lysobacter sp. CFH 32150]MCI4567783.1 CoA ester lyase [Lysobacter sp. CFH 32150]
MRSKLFIPGARRDLFAKALAGEADALSLDLEDSVPAESKADARMAVSEFIGSEAATSAAKAIIVRTNGPDTPWFEGDVQAVARSGLALLNLPKIESAEQLLATVQLLERAEAANNVPAPIRLLVNIETPKALANAAVIAAAHPRVAGLQVGLGDLFEPLGIDRGDPANVHAVLFAVRMAAAQAGVFVLDGAFPDIADADGFTEEARRARRLGYLGKSCIHPSQVALANAAFAATEAELAQARRIVEAAQVARREGRGAFVVDGRMVDLPFLKSAQALLAGNR